MERYYFMAFFVNKRKTWKIFGDSKSEILLNERKTEILQKSRIYYNRDFLYK